MDGLLSFLTPEQQAFARQQAQTQGLIGLGSALLQASQGQRGQPRPSLGAALGQAVPVGMQAYQSGIDQTLRELLVGQQLRDAQQKRQRDVAIQRALQLGTPQEQVAALRGLGAYDVLGQMATAEKGLRESGIMRQPGEAQMPSPFATYLQSPSPQVRQLAQTYEQGFQSGRIDENTADKRIESLAKMEDQFISRSESAKERGFAREMAAGEREEKKKEGTESQKLAAGFADRMVASSAIIDQLETAGGTPTEFTSLAGGVPFVGGYLQRKAMTPEQQRYKQAADNWIRANLRKESGAVIGADEMQAEYETYFPQPGDDPATIAQKAEARKVTTQAMIKNAGPVFSMPATAVRPKPRDVKNRYGLE